MLKPRLRINTLYGSSGNAFVILGCAGHALKDAGWSKEEIEKKLADMRSADYAHLLAVLLRTFKLTAATRMEAISLIALHGQSYTDKEV